MSDHYDYGYCDNCDTYHDDVNAAYKMQEPRQPTPEELDEIFQQQAAETPQHRKEGQPASTGNGATSAVKRMLWDETTTRSRLGEDGYRWFVECAERNLPTCRQCNGSGSVMMPDPIGIRRGLLVTTACPECSTYVENLTAFAKTYFEVVPRAYRRFKLRTLQPYPASPVPTERQEEVIAALKANPDKSYAFFAPAGAGKTAFATALFSEMLYRQYTRPHLRWNWFPVRRISTKAVLDQHSQWVNGRHSENVEPEVTSRKIAEATKAGHTCRLFLAVGF